MKNRLNKFNGLMWVISWCISAQTCLHATEPKELELFKSNKIVQSQKPNSTCYLIDKLSENIISNILSNFNFKNVKNDLFSTSATCKKLNKYVMQEFVIRHKSQNLYVWQDNLTLNPITLHTVNDRLRNILGLYNNIRGGMAEYNDVVIFRRLCAHFIQAPFFDSAAIPIMHVYLLQLHLDCSIPALSSAQHSHELKLQFNTAKEQYDQRWEAILSQKDHLYQYELALYFHYHQCVLVDKTYQPASKDPINPLMAVMNDDLLALKATPGLNETAKYAETWQQIICAEPTVTIRQLELAAYANFLAGVNARKMELMFAYFEKSAFYFGERLKAIKNAGMNPTIRDYETNCIVNLNAGHCAQDANLKFLCFAKVVMHREAQLKALKDAGLCPTTKALGKIAYENFLASFYLQELSLKATYLTQAAKFIKAAIGQEKREKKLRKLRRTRLYIYSDLEELNNYRAFPVAANLIKNGQHISTFVEYPRKQARESSRQR